MIYLVEHFYSIQGEGRYIGTPSLFFRFGACNLKCEGFACSEVAPDGTVVVGCDTVYAVNKEHFSSQWGKITKARELLNILELYELPEKSVDIVLTGGEPLLYAQDEIFVEFLQVLHQRGHRICFETNATIAVNFFKYEIYKECIFALSVKLSNSNEPYKKRVRGEVINSIATNAKDAYFKFSVDAESINLGLEDEIFDITSHAPSADVFCMPVGGDKKTVEANTPMLVEFCKAKGYNFSDRLHIRIWDANKGV
ncbi:radical SAM protein [Sulfurimonas hongkongensis]|uniref:7-carboxy-7-deazaguanine synthase n=1 Tax=Sulfurimonas hongkongensis TaxID=1172190 RepID=T0L1C2_9BACT|nr:7-carboxy-7-deazaguanine synthase QueE [Sulfurimonas hongkongensis]EQB39568.1 radical SAM protein [Sulfurimonas hongkongensis]